MLESNNTLALLGANNAQFIRAVTEPGNEGNCPGSFRVIQRTADVVANLLHETSV